jgi:hypothetical protein
LSSLSSVVSSKLPSAAVKDGHPGQRRDHTAVIALELAFVDGDPGGGGGGENGAGQRQCHQ